MLILKIEQQKDLRNESSKLSTYMQYWRYGYYRKALDNTKIICYYSKIHVPKHVHRRVIDWNHLCLNHRDTSRLLNTI